jgi:hypothetical protein
MHLIMLWVQLSLSMGIWLHTIVTNSPIMSGNTPPMTRKCIPLYKPVVNANITFRGKRRSYTLITSLYSSNRRRGNCKMTTIRCGPRTCSSSISTSSIRHAYPIVSLTSLVGLLWLHSPLCSIPIDMKHLNGPTFISKI